MAGLQCAKEIIDNLARLTQMTMCLFGLVGLRKRRVTQEQSDRVAKACDEAVAAFQVVMDEL